MPNATTTWFEAAPEVDGCARIAVALAILGLVSLSSFGTPSGWRADASLSPNQAGADGGGAGMGRPSCVQRHAQGSHARWTVPLLSGPNGSSRGGKIRGVSGVAPGANGSDRDA
jgi:hypothetical protein